MKQPHVKAIRFEEISSREIFHGSDLFVSDPEPYVCTEESDGEGRKKGGLQAVNSPPLAPNHQR